MGKGYWRRFLALLLAAAFVRGTVPTILAANAEPEKETRTPREVDFLSYEEAVGYFDFSSAAPKWCENFGLSGATMLEDAKAAILAGTDRRLIIGLATYFRDTGHAAEPIAVNNAFRPAAYQEVIGLHDSNGNTGPYRNTMTWNGRNVTGFWWTAENAPGWPGNYALDMSGFDVKTMDPKYFYRAALRLWDNGWIGSYYARPGCSGHNTGTAIDVSNYWIATNFAVAYDYNGETFYMEDYGLYKPLQPQPGYAGETWHITCAQESVGLGNYDAAFSAGFEIQYAMYYNPAHYGWSMEGGRSVYLGAGVAVVQLRLCQLGLLPEEYITGYYCTRTMQAVQQFQRQSGLSADGMCGADTTRALMDTAYEGADAVAPEMDMAEVTAVRPNGFDLQVAGTDNELLSAFRVETRDVDGETWVTRYYNAPAGGQGTLDVDIWREGRYEIRAASLDAAGNGSDWFSAGTVFVDTTAPRLREVKVSDIGAEGFALSIWGEDNGEITGFRVTLTSENREAVEEFRISAGYDTWEVPAPETGTWSLTVTAVDGCGNETGYTFSWRYTAGEAQMGRTVAYYG